MTKQDFLRTRVFRAATEMLIAGRDFDALAMDSVWRSVQAIAHEMSRTACDVPVPLDDALAREVMGVGPADDDSEGGGGHKVESSVPDPIVPPGGVSVKPGHRVGDDEGAALLADLLA